MKAKRKFYVFLLKNIYLVIQGQGDEITSGNDIVKPKIGRNHNKLFQGE